MENKFRQKLQAGRFVVTAEVAPPKGIDPLPALAEAELVASLVDAINVTELQSALMRMGSLALSIKLKQRGILPIMQMVCRDKNRLALQSELLAAASFGIENILIVSGDYPTFGDHPEAMPVFDLDSVQLLLAAQQLMQGTDMNGNKLDGLPPRFFLGAVVNPFSQPSELQILKMEKKVRAGAQFFQTQAVFDVDTFARFAQQVNYLKVPVLAGIVLLKSAKMARYMNEHVPGIVVPEEIIKEMEKASDRQRSCIDIAVRLIKQVRPLCQGIHIMALGWNRLVPTILKESGLLDDGTD